MTMQQVRDAVDANWASFAATLQTKQATYLGAHGRYFQGLPSHTATPADGNDAAPDSLTATPSYQTDSWASLGGFPATTKSVIECHQYDGPLGKGYLVFLTVLVGGRRWRRAIEFGPETFRNAAWNQG